MRHLPTHAALLALAAALAGPAIAADPPKKASFGAGKSGAPVLTREELRACFARQAKVAQTDEQLPKDKAALAATQDELLRSGESMKAAMETLDRTNEQAVTEFNEKSQARDKRIDEHQARVAEFNTRVQAAQGERDAFVKACANRDYFEEDAAAIKRGK
ncbi:MAG TPA: hypothetical protein VNU71_04330 [Burkholderiaceae bacterium]|nr:hypothetical protein [Burkholderiaceae bacterium]